MHLFKLASQSVDDKLEKEIGLYRHYGEDRPLHHDATAAAYVGKIQALLRNPERTKPAHLDGLDLSGIDLSATNLKGCSFQSCVLAAANFNHANLEDCHFDGSSLIQAQLDNIKINNETTFDNAYLAGCKIANSVLAMLEMSQAQGRLRLSF